MRVAALAGVRWLLVLVACSAPPAMTPVDAPPAMPWQPPFGAHYAPDGSEVAFRLASLHATAVELDLFADPTGDAVQTIAMTAGDGEWTARVPAAQATTYYGYRVSGPNPAG